MSLFLRSFQPAAEKVFTASFHPTQPWALSATKADAVCVWDYTTGQVLHELQLGGVGEDDLYANLDVVKLHERDAAVSINPSAAVFMNSSRTATGKIREAKFLDADVAAAQLAANNAMVNGSGVLCPNADPVEVGLGGQRLVVLVCEAKVLLWDLVAGGVRELPKAVLEGRSPTCCAFLFLGGLFSSSRDGSVMVSPVLALGCVDGAVRLVQVPSLRPVACLTAPHKSAVTCITSMGVRASAWEALVAGYQGGSLTLWEPFSRPLGAFGSASMGLKADAKSAHEKEVLGVVVAVVSESSEAPTRMLLSIGSDSKLVAWDPSTLKEVGRMKMDPRTPACCLVVVPRGFVASGIHCVLVGTEAGQVLNVHPTLNSIRVGINLHGLIPAGGKKFPKVYSLAVHPLQPHLVLAGTNTGTALLELGSIPPLPVAPLPLRAPAQVLDAGGSGVTYVIAIGDALHCVTAAAVKPGSALPVPSAATPLTPTRALSLLGALNEETSGPAASSLSRGGLSRPEPIPQAVMLKMPLVQVLGSVQLTSGKPVSRAVLGCSHDGSYVSAVWVAARQWAVYKQLAASWEEVASGSGSSIAWHACEPRFAVLMGGSTELAASTAAASQAATAAASAAAAKAVKGGVKGSKGAAREAERVRTEQVAAGAVALAAAANTPPAVQVRACSGRGVSIVHRAVPLSSSDTAEALHGGPLLGVQLRRTLSSAVGLAEGADPPHVLQLWDWDTAKRVGSDLPAPLVSPAWDPSLSLVALAYPTQVVVCSVRPTLTPVAHLAIRGATGLQWAMRQLYVVTVKTVHAAFMSLPQSGDPHPGPITVHLLELAVLGGPQVTAPGGPVGLSPRVLSRPPGPLALLGPRDGHLWVVNAHGQPVGLPLEAHSGIRALCLAAAGNTMGSAQAANQGVGHEAHDALSGLLCAWEGAAGAQAALMLAGLSLKEEARLRLMLRQWHQAMEAIEAALAGYLQRPPPGTFAYPTSSAAFGSLSDDGNGVLPDCLGGLQYLTPLSVSQYPDDIDWGLPLRQAATSTAAAAAAVLEQGASNPPRSITACPAALKLALALLQGLIEMGMKDAAIHMAQLLSSTYLASALAHPTLAASLVAAMADLGMRQELPGVAHQVVLGAVGGPLEAVGLLAALLSGHVGVAGDALRGAGAAAATAAYTAAQQGQGAG